MKKVLDFLLSPHTRTIWDICFIPNISSFWQDKTILGKGSRGTVYDYSTHQVCKVQPLFTEPSPHHNDSFVQFSTFFIYLKESFLLEALIMQELSSSLLIPHVYEFGFGFDPDTHQYISILVMDKILGSPYQPEYLSNTQIRPLWTQFFQQLQQLYESCFFVHGDLIPENLVLHEQKLKCIDFGLSSAYFHGFFFCRYHVFYKNFIPIFLKDRTILNTIKKSASKNCKSLVHLIQTHRQSIDICTICRHPFPFPSTFQKKMYSCIGRDGVKLSTKNKPFPMYYSRIPITYAQILQILS